MASGDGASTGARAHSSAPYVWYVIVLLSVVNVFNYMDRMALAVLLPYIKADLELSDAQLGLLTGLAFSLFYAICGIPIARWADRGIRRNIIAISLATWSVMTALSGAAANMWHLFLARLGLGIGEAGCLPPAQSILCDYVPLERRSGVFALHTFGLITGMMVGMMLAGWLGETIGWRWTFVAIGLPGVALAVLVRVTLREPVRGRFDSARELAESPSWLQMAIVLWRCRTYRQLLYLGAANGFLTSALYQWWPSFYAREFGLGLSSVGVYLGFAIGMGSGAGLLFGGLLANKIARRDVKLPLMMGVVTTTLALPVTLGSLFVSTVAHSMLCVALAAALWNISIGPVVATLYSVVRPQMRATAGAINIFFTSVLGFGLGPLCVGFLSDLLAPTLGVASLRYALILPICFLPPMAIMLYVAAQKLAGDLKAVNHAPD